MTGQGLDAEEEQAALDVGPEMLGRVDTFTGTAADLVDWVMQRGLGMSAVTITQCHLKYRTPATEEELARRAEFHAAAQRRTDEWERAAYKRLKAKFEPSPLVAGLGVSDNKKETLNDA